MVKAAHKEQDDFPPASVGQMLFDLFPTRLAMTVIVAVPVMDILRGKIFPEGGVDEPEDTAAGPLFHQQACALLRAFDESFGFGESIVLVRTSGIGRFVTVFQQAIGRSLLQLSPADGFSVFIMKEAGYMSKKILVLLNPDTINPSSLVIFGWTLRKS